MSIQRAIIMINLAFIALGAYFAVGLVYQIIGLRLHPSEQTTLSRSSQIRSESTVQQPYSAYQPILQRDLFKTAGRKSTPVQNSSVNLEDMEATKLKLKLWGTVSGDAEKSYAVIENTQDRQQNLYRVGDSIQNATVKMILRSKVVLSVDGRDEVLAMEEIKQSGQRTPSRASSSVRSIISPTPGGIRTQRISLRRNMIDNAIQDVSKLMTEIKITPHTNEQGQSDGLALSNIKPNSIFRRMGLRNGDVLKSVDGQSIQSVDDALKLYENLKSADNVAVTINRRGQERTIDYNIR